MHVFAYLLLVVMNGRAEVWGLVKKIGRRQRLAALSLVASRLLPHPSQLTPIHPALSPTLVGAVVMSESASAPLPNMSANDKGEA